MGRVRKACGIWTILLVSGCGGSDAPKRNAQPRPDGPFIATLGDSIVAGSPLWDPDPRVRATFPMVDKNSQWQRWVDTKTMLRNCGAWGERTDQIGLRYRDCVTGASAVVVQGGINDIAKGRDVRNAAMDLACMVDQAIADDLPVAMVEVLPWNNADEANVVRIRELNELIAQVASERGVPVMPFFATLEDPTAPDRMPATLTIDGDHPTVEGYRMLGEQAWREPKPGTPFKPQRMGDCAHLDLH